MRVVKNVHGAAAILSVLLLAAGDARAADPSAEKARAHFQQGDTYFKLDKYANALQEFEKAYLAKQDASFLYNIAQCHRLMGNRVEAIRFYKRYIADAPTAANRPVAEKHIRDLEAAQAAGEPTGPHVTPAPATPAGDTGGSAPPPPSPAPPTAVALNAPTEPPLPAPSGTVLASSQSPSQSNDDPIYTKWWFWTAVGGLAASVLLVAWWTSRDPSCPDMRTCQ
jgi:tetratricopeptide (TPR) repeat protein